MLLAATLVFAQALLAMGHPSLRLKTRDNLPGFVPAPMVLDFPGHIPLPSLDSVQSANAANGNTFNVTNIQADILVGMKKPQERFVFFTINDAATFKKVLRSQIVPLITNTKSVLNAPTQAAALLNIAFSQKGLTTLGNKDNLGSSTFTSGMAADASNLGDNGGTQGWIAGLNRANHGLFLIASDQTSNIDALLTRLQTFFGKAMTIQYTLNGAARPGDQAGHEHFGWLDGISQPAIKGFTQQAHPGQSTIDGGIILTGHTGDNGQRPAWTKDGSFLVFRQLAQLVPEFHSFLTANPLKGNNLTATSGSALLGARMFGRWPSGAPTDLTPNVDDPVMGKDPNRNNNFDFNHAEIKGFNLASDQSRCPFSAHIRRTRPRADLGNSNTANQIIRAGIPYGPELTSAEQSSGKSGQTERGLAFVSYQSDIDQGFRFQQVSWADNTFFPFGKTVPSPNMGFDAIIGQNGAQSRSVFGSDPTNLAKAENFGPGSFIKSRGGEYFFSPSISALATTLST